MTFVISKVTKYTLSNYLIHVIIKSQKTLATLERMMNMLEITVFICIIALPFVIPFLIINVVGKTDKEKKKINNVSAQITANKKFVNSGFDSIPPIYRNPPFTDPYKNQCIDNSFAVQVGKTQTPYSQPQSFERNQNNITPVLDNNTIKREENASPKFRKHDMTVSNVLFLIGTVFVVLSGIAFGVASWVHTSNIGRVAIIAAAAIISLCLSAVVKKFIKLSGTSIAFYILGTGFVSTAILTSGYYRLMGNWLSFDGDGCSALLAFACATAAVMLFIGYFVFRKLPILYTAFSFSALTLLFTAIQIGDTYEYISFILIILEAIIMAFALGVGKEKKSDLITAFKTVGTVTASSFGLISSMYVLSVLQRPTMFSYIIVTLIIIQLLYYGIKYRVRALFISEAAITSLLVIMASITVSNEEGKRYGFIVFAALMLLIYVIHRFVPVLKCIQNEILTLSFMILGAVICAVNMTAYAFIPELIIVVAVDFIITGYVFHKNETVQLVAGVSAPLLPLLITYYLINVFKDILDMDYKGVSAICWSSLALLFTVAAVTMMYISKKSEGLFSKLNKKTDAGIYSYLSFAGTLLIFAAMFDRYAAIPCAVCLIHFAVSNKLYNNITAIGSALAVSVTLFNFLYENDSVSRYIGLFVLVALFIFYMTISKFIYSKSLIEKKETRIIIDPMLFVGWLIIIFIGAFQTRYTQFSILIALAVYCICFIKKNTSYTVASSLLSASAVLTASAIITRPFLIPESKEISSKITLAVAVLVGVACRFIWRKYADAAKISSQGIFISCFVALLIDDIVFDNAANTIAVMSIMISVLFVSIIIRSKTWFIISSSSLFIITVYTTRDYLMALNWWIYLFIAGIILIFLAAVNEYCKKNNETLKSSVAKRFSGWTW